MYNTGNRSILKTVPNKPHIYTEILSSNFTVPADFPGHHIGSYPMAYGSVGNPIYTVNLATPGSGIAQPPPVFGVGSMRSHDCAYGFWRNNNPSQGTYDWVYLDAAIAASKTLGASFWYTFFGTPTWAASTLNGMNTWSDIYNKVGGCAPPAQLSYVSDFITALITRYNTGANSGSNRGIKVLEIWNEPVFKQPTTSTAAKNMFYWGSVQDMLAMSNLIYNTAKALDPGIIISSPGFSGNTYAMQWLSNQETVTSKFGYQLCDVFSIHPYNCFPTPADCANNLLEANDGGFYNQYSSTSAWPCFNFLKTAAPTMPLFYSEFGLDSANPGIHAGVATGLAVSDFLARPVSQRRGRIIRTGLVTLMQGVSNIYFYSYGSLLCGALLDNVSDGADTPTRYPIDTNGVVSGMIYLRSLAGKTITSGGYWSDGTVVANFSDGTSIRI
jgi:hypothetical protein